MVTLNLVTLVRLLPAPLAFVSLFCSTENYVCFFLIQCDHAEIGYQYELNIFGLHIPNRIPPWQIKTVKIRARVGSPRLEDTANGLRNGMTSSFAMACSKRGAPVKLCSPAPSVDKNEPTRMTHSLGHAILATTNFPPIDAPNLYAIHDKGQLIWVQIVFVIVLINMRRIRASFDWNNIWRQSNDWFNYSFFLICVQHWKRKL